MGCEKEGEFSMLSDKLPFLVDVRCLQKLVSETACYAQFFAVKYVGGSVRSGG